MGLSILITACGACSAVSMPGDKRKCGPGFTREDPANPVAISSKRDALSA
jgi:hypothetical protein